MKAAEAETQRPNSFSVSVLTSSRNTEDITHQLVELVELIMNNKQTFMCKFELPLNYLNSPSFINHQPSAHEQGF